MGKIYFEPSAQLLPKLSLFCNFLDSRKKVEYFLKSVKKIFSMNRKGQQDIFSEALLMNCSFVTSQPGLEGL